jgi:hypothetical protein
MKISGVGEGVCKICGKISVEGTGFTSDFLVLRTAAEPKNLMTKVATAAHGS